MCICHRGICIKTAHYLISFTYVLGLCAASERAMFDSREKRSNDPSCQEPQRQAQTVSDHNFETLENMYLYQQACEFLNNETAALEKELKKKDEYLNELYAENRKLKELERHYMTKVQQLHNMKRKA